MYSINKGICFVVVLALISAAIVEFDNTAVQRVFTDKANTLFLFTSTNDRSSAAKKVFEEFDSTNPSDLFLTISDSEDGHNFYQRLGEFLGVDISNAPHIVYFTSSQVKYLFEGQISLSSLQDFLAKAQSGQLQPYLKSDQIPESNDEPVKVIVGKMFKEYVLNSDKEFLIEFYAPWCGHCKHLAPKYEEAAKILSSNPNIVLAKVDSTNNEILGLNIQGFPTLKFWRKDKSLDPIEYDGPRQVQGIVDWLKGHTEYPWVDGEAQQEL